MKASIIEPDRTRWEVTGKVYRKKDTYLPSKTAVVTISELVLML